MIRPILFAVAVLTAAPAAAVELEIEFEHDGVTRYAEVVVPDQRFDGDPGPAILTLHGEGGSPRRVRRYTNFGFAQRGWVEIYPAALDRNWNDGRVGADGQPLRTTDDAGFLRALIERLAGDGLVDPTRIYVSGASNGGMMTMRLACDAPDLVAGAAIAIASWPVGLDCASDRPIPTLILHGTEDELIGFDGGAVVPERDADRGAVLSGPATLTIWATRNRCGGFREFALPDLDPEDGTRVTRRVYQDCAAPLTHFIVEGGGHTWPGRKDRWLLRQFLGRTSQDMDLSNEIESFFLGADASR
jgi:polyhydroxybutyrate depolymerase